jgi:hypothetical protein
MNLRAACVATLDALTKDGDPLFREVGGAADHAAAIEDPERFPAAYVVHGEFAALPNQTSGPWVHQEQIEQVVVWLALANGRSRRGEDAVVQADEVEARVDAALLGLLVDGYDPMEKMSANTHGYDQAVLWRVLTFVAAKQISSPAQPFTG